MKPRYIKYLCLFLCACGSASPQAKDQTPIDTVSVIAEAEPTLPLADGFDFPVGPPDAKKYYNAQPFGENLHLGDDWNGRGGGNSDLGDPVYSVARGLVVEANDFGGGWGNVLRIVHQLDSAGRQVESLYAHLDTILLEEGDFVERGDQIATIGNANGAYWAHLHLEIRAKVGLALGGGYSQNTDGYLDPTLFIREHRPIKR
ncbi:MAG: M23 family metallopeptidase [Bacteroidota bacterium]